MEENARFMEDQMKKEREFLTYVAKILNHKSRLCVVFTDSMTIKFGVIRESFRKVLIYCIYNFPRTSS